MAGGAGEDDDDGGDGGEGGVTRSDSGEKVGANNDGADDPRDELDRDRRPGTLLWRLSESAASQPHVAPPFKQRMHGLPPRERVRARSRRRDLRRRGDGESIREAGEAEERRSSETRVRRAGAIQHRRASAARKRCASDRASDGDFPFDE